MQLDAALVSTFDERDMHVEKQCEAAEARLAKLRAQIQECHDRKYVSFTDGVSTS